jgi:hypothetical protein
MAVRATDRPAYPPLDHDWAIVNFLGEPIGSGDSRHRSAVWSSPLTQVVWLSDDVARLIARDAERWGLRETGGTLFGYEACGELVITEALLPGPKATHLPFLLRPDRYAVDRAVAEIYERSGGGERWIGSWQPRIFCRIAARCGG